MSLHNNNRGSARQVALAVLVAFVVTVGAVAPVVAGASSSGGVYQISGMDVPSSVTTDESFTVSATLSNDGGIDMQVVAFRIDANGDGEFTPDESLGAEAFVLLAGASRNVTFEVAVPEGLAPGGYEYMLYTESGTETGTITVESPITPATDDVSQALYGTGAENLTGSEVMTVEDVRNRLADGESGISVDEIRTLEEILNEMYDRPFDELSNEELMEAQNAYDAQFETPVENPEYTRTEIVRLVFPKFTGTYDELSGESAVEVAELYNRQPFVENVTESDVETREQVAERILGIAMPGGERMGSTTWDDLTREELLEVQAVYESQFE